MPPRVFSSVSRSFNGPRDNGYQSPAGRGAKFTVDVEFGDLPTLPDRLGDAFDHALIFHLGDAAQRVIDTTRSYLVRLNEPAVMTNAEGKEIHGYDTGLMYVSLKYELARELLHTGVFYELFSDEAKYWRYVEFGFHRRDGSWWPGYHMLETAIEENEGYIRQRVREAWADTAIHLAMEAHHPSAIGRLFGALHG